MEQADPRVRISSNNIGKRLAADTQIVNCGDNDADSEDSPLQSKRASMLLLILIFYLDPLFVFIVYKVEFLFLEKNWQKKKRKNGKQFII